MSLIGGHMIKNERTSKKIATIAGRILETLQSEHLGGKHSLRIGFHKICTVDELKSLCASALTQTPDKPKKK